MRKQVLWGTILAGGGGVEDYFGYKLPQNDLVCEDWRSRDRSWDYCRIALDFFKDEKIPFHEMTNADGLVGNDKRLAERIAKPVGIEAVVVGHLLDQPLPYPRIIHPTTSMMCAP